MRREVRSLAYIDLGRDNGGIVLNLSEGGMAIHSAVILNERRLPRLRFQLPHSYDWVEARGEIAWTSETKMQAGIQLIGLGDDARKKIREWVNANGRASTATREPPNAVEKAPQNPSQPSAIQMPLNPPVPAVREQDAVPRESPNGGHARRPAFTSVLSLGAPSPWVDTKADGLPISKTAESRHPDAGTELSLRIGQALPPPKLRPVWISWAAFAAFLAGMAALSFFAGLMSGRHNLGSSIARLWRADSYPASVSNASEQTGADPVRGSRVIITSRMYVPVAIPALVDAPKADRLEVGAIQSRIDPQYPQQAAAQHIEGTVQLHATISANGSVENVASLSGPSALVQSATDAVRQWRFKPTLLDGKPIETEADIAIVFWLPPPSQNPQAKLH